MLIVPQVLGEGDGDNQFIKEFCDKKFLSYRIINDPLTKNFKFEARSVLGINLTIGTERTMSSLEIVALINNIRKEDEAELRHSDFLTKVPEVLGLDESGKFRSHTKVGMPNGGFREQPIYNFPKREAFLMAMSSREIAEVTGKEHIHVVRDIKNMLKSLSLDESTFGLKTLHPVNGLEVQEYLLPFDEITYPGVKRSTKPCTRKQSRG